MKLEPFTCRLDGDQLRRLTALSRQRQQTRAELIRLALEEFLQSSETQQPSLNRIAQTVEFIQIALDHVHKKDIEPVRDGIMLNVAKRMEQFHGTR